MNYAAIRMVMLGGGSMAAFALASPAYAGDTCDLDGTNGGNNAASASGGATATGTNSLACGNGAGASGNDSTAIGSGAQTADVFNQDGFATVVGNGAAAAPSGVVVCE